MSKPPPQPQFTEREGIGPDARLGLAKARIIGDAAQDSNVLQGVDEHVTHSFRNAGAVEPPYDPRHLILLMEHSNALSSNIDAYKTNIDGHGHRFEPVIDVSADDTLERVKTAMVLDRQERALAEADPEAFKDPEFDPFAQLEAPDEATVAQMVADIKAKMAVEKMRLEHWFEFAVDGMSFIELRRRVRTDKELTGNGYVEVLRDGRGAPARLTYIQAHTMRLLPIDGPVTEVEEIVPTASKLGTKKITRRQRFRRFVQIHQGRTTFFKEYGDPRTLSAKTGRAYADEKTMLKAEGEENAQTASEVLHYRIHSPRSAYGIPRWIGNLLSVLGNRQAEEVNYLYFDNKSVPPLAILVSGGRLTDESVKRIEGYVENEIKGRKNFHSILILEAEGDSTQAFENSGRMRIEMEPLTNAQHGDGLFMKYDERNMDKIGQSFRLPRLLRGDIRDFNRATADAALEFVEGQVFAPERNEFDHGLNRTIMRDLGARWWHFKSNGTTKVNPLELVEMIAKLADIFPPKVLQELAEEAFGRDFPDSDEDWVKVPFKYFQAGVRPGDTAGAAPAATPGAATAEDEAGGGNTEKSEDAMKTFLQLLLRARAELMAQEKLAAGAELRDRIGEGADGDL